MLCPPCPRCQKLGGGGTCPRQLYGAGAYACIGIKLLENVVTADIVARAVRFTKPRSSEIHI